MIRILATDIFILVLTLAGTAASGHTSRMLLAGGLLLLINTMALTPE